MTPKTVARVSIELIPHGVVMLIVGVASLSYALARVDDAKAIFTDFALGFAIVGVVFGSAAALSLHRALQLPYHPTPISFESPSLTFRRGALSLLPAGIALAAIGIIFDEPALVSGCAFAAALTFLVAAAWINRRENTQSVFVLRRARYRWQASDFSVAPRASHDRDSSRLVDA